MRKLIYALTLLPFLAACATPEPPPGRIVTSDQANRSGLAGAASAPLRDVNLMRTEIPSVLLDALADPYERPRPFTCAQYIALVRPLDEALGPDFDVPTADDASLVRKANDMALGGAASVAQDIVPFRGWVRRLSGAQRHDALVSAAITAGASRRAYLKGLGEARNCRTPAIPRRAAPVRATPVARAATPRPKAAPVSRTPPARR
jgi:hypothetical protein